MADAGFPDDDSEKVLVQSRDGSTVGDPAFDAAVADVERGSAGSRTWRRSRRR